MALAPSVQRKIMWLTPQWVLEFLCRFRPRFVIGLLCHWLNEKNIFIEERFLAPRQINPVAVAKKMSQLSVLSILNLLRQDEGLWQFYAPTPTGGVMINLQTLPFILLQLMFDLGGKKGREKVVQIILKCRKTIGGGTQGAILRNLNTETVVDIFEMILETPGGGPVEVRMCLMNTRSDEAVAIWLEHWDRRMGKVDKPAQSLQWIARLPGDRAFRIEFLLKTLEFRKKYEPTKSIYDYHKDAFFEES